MTREDAKRAKGAIWIVADDVGEEAPLPALALIEEARGLAGPGGHLSVVMEGRGACAHAPVAGHHGADSVMIVRPARSDQLGVSALAEAIAELVRARAPRLLLFTSTPRALQTAARASVRLGLACVSNVTRLDLDPDGAIRVTKPVYGGRAQLALRAAPDATLLVAVKAGVFTPGRADESRRADIVEIAVDAADETGDAARVLEIQRPDPATLDLGEARVVLGRGRGVGGSADFGRIDELAKLMGAAIGGTRVAVDAGWIPLSRQIGQTGKVIAPRLYLACGVSGASHHMAGVRDAGLVVAINKDRTAPIVTMADIAAIGDLNEILPEMIAEVRRHQARADDIVRDREGAE